MKTLLFISEGPTDLGSSVFNDDLSSEKTGTIATFVKKILSDITHKNIDFNVKTERLARLHHHHKKGNKYVLKGYEKKIHYVMKMLADPYGKYADCDGIVFVVDQDNDPKRIERLRSGKEQARKIFELQNIRIAVGVAILMIEAWLLADPKAIGLGLAIPTPDTSPNPEIIKSPKAYLRSFFKEEDERSTVEKYEAIAQKIDIKKLSNRCKKGFQPFHEEIKDEFKSLF